MPAFLLVFIPLLVNSMVQKEYPAETPDTLFALTKARHLIGNYHNSLGRPIRYLGKRPPISSQVRALDKGE